MNPDLIAVYALMGFVTFVSGASLGWSFQETLAAAVLWPVVWLAYFLVGVISLSARLYGMLRDAC